MKKVFGIILGLMATLTIATPAFAIALPDSTPSVIKKYVYRNLIESGDKLVVWEANIPYAVTPTTPVTQTFTWRLIGTDGTTELGTTTGYAYDKLGYGYNVYSMYFAAADNFTWGTAYTLRLSGNPIHFGAPPEYNFTIAVSDYTSLTTQADNQAALAATVLLLAQDLNIAWGLTTATSLLTEDEASTVLSVYGEAVFRGSIYSLQSMAPTVFSHIITNLTLTNRTFGTGYSDNITNQWAGTWVQTAKAAGNTLWGTSYDLMSILLVLICCAGVIGLNVWASGDIWAGLLDSGNVAIVMARLAFYPLAFLSLIGALLWIYTGGKIWGQFR